MKRILNFGALNIDHVYGVPHFVAPGESLSVLNYEIFPGGKGLNQSIALAKAGAPVWMAGKIGTDGVWLTELLSQAGGHGELIVQGAESTGHAIIQIGPTGQNCILYSAGANQTVTQEDIEAALAPFEAGDLILLQNEINGVAEIMAAAARKGMEIAFNPSPLTESALRCPLEQVTWFLVNEVEGEQLTGKTDPEEIEAELLRRYPGAKIVLTLGTRGVRFRSAEEQWNQGIFPVKAVDTTGAGDTFTGYFLAAITEGQSVPEALKLASAASALAVSRKGAASSIPTREEVEATGWL